MSAMKTDPMDSGRVTAENFRSWNDEMIDKYDPDLYHTNSHFFIQIIIHMMIKRMRQMLTLDRSDRVLEVGCGAGNILERMVPGGHLFGIDLSSKLLDKARKRCGGQAGLLAAKAEELPFKAGSFNKVLCTEVIEHLLLPEECLAEIERVATEDATIVITTTNEVFLNRLKSLFWKFGLQKIIFRGDGYKPEKRMDDEWHLQAFDTESFKRLLRKYFHLNQISFIPSIFFPIQIVVKCSKISHE